MNREVPPRAERSTADCHPNMWRRSKISMHKMHDMGSCVSTRLQAVIESFIPEYRGKIPPGFFDERIGHRPGIGVVGAGPLHVLYEHGFAIQEYRSLHAERVLSEGASYLIARNVGYGESEADARARYTEEYVRTMQRNILNDQAVHDRFASQHQRMDAYRPTPEELTAALDAGCLVELATKESWWGHAELLHGYGIEDGELSTFLHKSPSPRGAGMFVRHDAETYCTEESQILWDRGARVIWHPQYQLERNDLVF